MIDKTRITFKLNLIILEQICVLLTDDYLIESRITNSNFLMDHLPKTRLERMRALFKRCDKFIYKSLEKRDMPIDQTIKIKKQIADQHKYLTQLHMEKFYQNRTESWNYLSLSIHHLLDCYYHILLQATATKASCIWCQCEPANWDEANQLISSKLVKAFVYLNLSQDIWLLHDVSIESINDYIVNMKFLVEKSIKDDIMKTADLSLTPCKVAS